MVLPDDADAFFAIMPPPDVVKRADAARENRPRAVPPRMAKITAETMAAVFDGGRLTLTRKQAVPRSCFCARCLQRPCAG